MPTASINTWNTRTDSFHAERYTASTVAAVKRWANRKIKESAALGDDQAEAWIYAADMTYYRRDRGYSTDGRWVPAW